MFKTTADIKIKHKRFIEEVVRTQEVWTLRNEIGYVSSTSNVFEDDINEPLLLQIFWSSKNEALYCSRINWKQECFILDLIPLNEFIERWCIGMYFDNVIVGTNFDHQLFGYEEHPLLLVKELLAACKKQDLELKFYNYKSIEELIIEVDKELVGKQF